MVDMQLEAILQQLQLYHYMQCCWGVLNVLSSMSLLLGALKIPYMSSAEFSVPVLINKWTTSLTHNTVNTCTACEGCTYVQIVNISDRKGILSVTNGCITIIQKIEDIFTFYKPLTEKVILKFVSLRSCLTTNMFPDRKFRRVIVGCEFTLLTHSKRAKVDP